MSIDSVAAANLYSTVGTNFAASSTKTTTNTDLGMQDFFELLSAQMQNQDMMNPVSDTEFIAQMAEFSALSAMQSLNSKFDTYMAVSYIGKTATATQTGADGKQTTITGVVKSVDFSSDSTSITIGDTKVPIEQVTSVSI